MAGVSRRQFLVVAGAGAAGLTASACTGPSTPRPVGPSSAAVGQAEAGHRRPGVATRAVALVAGPATLDLAGTRVATWAYNGTVPGPVVRLRAGEVLRAELTNRLPEPTTIHWHGVALRNDMDGVPDVTQPPVPPGGRFTYQFTAPNAGTFF